MAVNVARLLTMNVEALKDLPLEDVLEIHPLLDTTGLQWRKVKKTKPIKARPISTILSDNSVMSKVVLATLEGHETIKANAFVCWGIDNDLWQQKGSALHAKYTPVQVDEDGWVHFEPKPDVEVNFAQVTDQMGPFGGFSIASPWGDERVIDGKQVHLQYGIVNDWVGMGLRKDGSDNPDDVYRVACKFFNNTYDFV
jgi:hypothetical protein